MADAKAATEAEALAGDQQTVEDTAAAASEQPAPAAGADYCPAQVINADGTIRCVDALTSDAIAAIAAGSDTGSETQAEVITETVTESTHRSSSEEFGQSNPVEETAGEETGATASSDAATAQPDTGLSDLEKAGLIFLGAVAVGAILSNGQRVETNTGDRVIVKEDDGSFRVLKDDDALLRQPGSEVRTERFNDGSTRTTVTRADGTRIVTIRDSTGRALRRVRIDPDGLEYLLIDDTRTFEPVIVPELPNPAQNAYDYREASDAESLRLALLAAERRDIGRSFSLRQVREYAEVRALAPVINLQSITFATNSAALQPSQAKQLRQMGLLMRELIAKDPTELFLVEGHTDAVGSADYNLLLSDRRAESVALAFSEYFGVPTENMVVQGYGESFLQVPTLEAERVNRRVAVRRITRLLYRY
ncbi:OmpA family protein [Tropicimonas sp. IMCC6043]|nr:OmpA family protein [Tropicimonas sp. IMCC6043]